MLSRPKYLCRAVLGLPWHPNDKVNHTLRSSKMISVMKGVPNRECSVRYSDMGAASQTLAPKNIQNQFSQWRVIWRARNRRCCILWEEKSHDSAGDGDRTQLFFTLDVHMKPEFAQKAMGTQWSHCINLREILRTWSCCKWMLSEKWYCTKWLNGSRI